MNFIFIAFYSLFCKGNDKIEFQFKALVHYPHKEIGIKTFTIGVGPNLIQPTISSEELCKSVNF